MKVDLPIQLPQKYVKWSLIASSLVFVCGILAIVLPLTFSLGIAVFLGLVVLVAGMAHAVFSEHSFARRYAGGFSHPGRRLGTRSLFSPQTIPPLVLGAH